jgi:YbbR domain-containing protein
MLREIFLKDFGWKLFSLLLAAFIWYTVQKLIEEPRAAAVAPANIPVEYGEIPITAVAAAADVHLYGINSNTVSVTVSGPPEVMNVLQANQIHATVDLSDITGKTKDLNRRVDVSVPWGVTVGKVEPPTVLIVPPAKP